MNLQRLLSLYKHAPNSLFSLTSVLMVYIYFPLTCSGLSPGKTSDFPLGLWHGWEAPSPASNHCTKAQGVSKYEWLSRLSLSWFLKGKHCLKFPLWVPGGWNHPLLTVALLHKWSLGTCSAAPHSSVHPLHIDTKVCPWLVPPAQAIFWFLVTVSSVALSFSRYVVCN